MGYFIRFIHCRDLAAENITTSYTRFRLLLDSAPGSVAKLLARLTDAGFTLPARSMLRSASDVLLSRGQLPGEFGVAIAPSRRNSRVLDELPATVSRDIHKLLDKWGHPAAYRPAQQSKLIKGKVAACGGVILSCWREMA